MKPFTALTAIIVGLVIAFALFYVGSIMHEAFQLSYIASQEAQVCYAHGYSKRLWADGKSYCYRLVNGTETVIPLEQLK